MLVAFCAGVGAAGLAEAADVTDRRLPIRAGAQNTVMADPAMLAGGGDVRVIWSVRTDRKLIALTFDDGPGPRWTPMVLDTLARLDVPATFFMVGRQARRHADLVRGRMAGHEVGSHSWAHGDLARSDADDAYADLARTHQALFDATGQEPRLLRPPWGHLGGGALCAAARLRYQVALWSLRMRESAFVGDPSGHARQIVDGARPGTILLAHDVGPADRLVALRGLPEMIDGLRATGYRFVTVSGLLAAQTPTDAHQVR